MTDIFEMNLVDEIVASTFGEHYKEFCGNIDNLDSIWDHNFMEAVKDATPNLRGNINKIGKNTYDTTKDVIGAYNNVVDANASAIKNTWDLVMRAVNLMTRILGFVISKIGTIPKLILKLANAIGDIPNEVRNKIQGNIELYITVQDIEAIYNQNLIARLDQFISMGTKLSQGELWGTFFMRSAKIVNGKVYASQNDIKAAKQLRKIYEHIKNLEFTKSTIIMKDENARNMYFGSSKSISFTDLKGNKFSGTYFEALNKLVDDINSRKDELDQIHKLLGKKYDHTLMNQTFSKLNRSDRYYITDTIRMMSKVVTVVGNMTRYVMEDIKTINKATNKILKSK